MIRYASILLIAMIFPLVPGYSQGNRVKSNGGNGWDRTKMIMGCAPRLVERSDLVEDNFEHRYVTSNPRDIEVGYFSVEPVTYHEQGRRFCEALLPAAGVSETHFRGTYLTSYTLPGPGVYSIKFTSRALVFNNELMIIDAQNTTGWIEVSHCLDIEADTSMNPAIHRESRASGRAYEWVLEIDPSGSWKGDLLPGALELVDNRIPAGFSNLERELTLRGPGKVVIRESVVFDMRTVSPYKYDPIFQVACLFSLEPLCISAWLLPCGE
jgi:hypothetical protein